MDFDSADFWRDHVSVGQSELARMYPKSMDGGATRPGWGHRRSAARVKWPALDWPPEHQGRKVGAGSIETKPIAEVVEEDIARQAVEDELRETRTKYRALKREQSIYRKLAEQGSEALEPIAPLCEPPKLHVAHGATVQGMVLNWADWHVEHQFGPDVMEGLNWYDPPTVLRRVACCVDKTIMFSGIYGDRITFPTLYVHDFGDNCQNFLHEDDAPTNSMPPLKAARWAAEIKAAALRDLSAHFPRVIFRGVPGNHGRTTKKVAWGLPTENLDWLVYQWTRDKCRDLPNVSFELEDAWSATVDVEGWGFFLNHGTTDAKGGFGGISWYTQMKSDTKRTAIDVKLGRHVLVRQYGHLHQEADTPRAAGNGRIRVEPSLVGGDPFTLEGMAGTYSEPAQTLMEIHAEEGIVCDRALNVRRYETAETCRYDSLLALVA